MVYAFIDTNVLLHYQFFRDVDWAAELDAPEVTLVFAPVVLAELDRHKWGGSKREKQRAKAVLKALDDLGLSATPVLVRHKVWAMGVDTEPDDPAFARHRLQPSSNDDRLLASLLGFRETHADYRVLLLSADGALRMKARSRQIEVVAPSEHLQSPDEPDEAERELEAARRELRAIHNAAPHLGVTIDGGTHIEAEVRFVTALERETLDGLLSQWRRKNPRLVGTPSSVRLPDGTVFSMPDFGPFSGRLSESDADEHNQTVELVFNEYQQYLRDWPDVVNGYRRLIELRFVLENAGTAPADDVDLLVSTDAPGIWLAERPDVPLPPVIPRRRSPLDFALDPRAYQMPEIDTSHLMPVGPIDGPDIPEDDPTQAEYRVNRVKHHVPCELPPVYFQFDTNDAVRSFAISYRLVAANIREPKSGELHVKVTVLPLEAPPVPGEVVNTEEDDE